MSGRLDPPHERVTLTRDELRSLARLEQVFSESPAITGVSPGLRVRVLAGCLRVVRLGPVLVPIGIVLMLATLSSSVLLSAVGAVLAASGFALWVRGPWLRVGTWMRAITRRG